MLKVLIIIIVIALVVIGPVLFLGYCISEGLNQKYGNVDCMMMEECENLKKNNDIKQPHDK